MSKLNTLRDGLLIELKDLYSAEHQLLKALPKMEKKATSRTLKLAISGHLKETEGQIERLDEIETILKEKLTGKTCKAMQGLIEEGKEVLEENGSNKALIDALLIGAARRVEHYEMAAYCTARAMANELGEEAVAELLSATFDEEMNADKKLSSISEDEVLCQANISSETTEKHGVPKGAVMGRSASPKKSGNNARLLGLVGFILLGSQVCSIAQAESKSNRVQNEQEASQYKPDNSGRNTRDRNDSRKTADDQNLGGTDLQVLARIRKEIMANKDLSSKGHNVKIVVENGQITLRGPVKSVQEKTWIEEAATRVTSGFTVNNQLEISHS